jgi:antitoxin ParD1/3/4
MAGNANLGPRLERYVTDLVEKGRYRSRSEVLQECVRLVEERENRLIALDDAIARGIADSQTGRVKTLVEVEHALTARSQALAQKSEP